MAAKMSKARVVMTLPVLLALGACESSSRLGSLMPGSSGGYAPPPRVGSRAAPSPLTPAPVGDVQTSDLSGGSVASSALPPPSGPSTMPPASPSMPPRSGSLSAPGNFGSASAPIDPPPAPPSSPSAPAANSQTYFPSGGNAAPAANPATLPRVATAPSAPAPTSRNAVIGNWSVSEAQGSSCRITLSSAPKLDLYGAGTTGCQTKELQRVNAWELSGSELLLYEPGGGVVARLRQGGSGYSGATARTGAPVSISK